MNSKQVPVHQALYEHHIDKLQSGAYTTVEYCNIKLLVHGSLYKLPFFSAVSEIFSIKLNAIHCAFKLKCFKYENIVTIDKRNKIWPQIQLFCRKLSINISQYWVYYQKKSIRSLD